MIGLTAFLALGLAAGIAAKAADFFGDARGKNRNALGIVLGLAYGSIVGFLLVSGPEFFALISGIILGNVFSGKIDSPAHKVSFVPIALFLFFFGIPSGASAVLVAVFAAGAYADEFLNGLKKRGRKAGAISNAIRFFGKYRLALEAIAIIVSVALWNASYFLLLVAFDSGYIVSAKAFENRKKGF
ncbi:MAG: hypothetical protein WC602_06090 [archaeon]